MAGKGLVVLRVTSWPTVLHSSYGHISTQNYASALPTFVLPGNHTDGLTETDKPHLRDSLAVPARDPV